MHLYICTTYYIHVQIYDIKNITIKYDKYALNDINIFNKLFLQKTIIGNIGNNYGNNKESNHVSNSKNSI